VGAVLCLIAFFNALNLITYHSQVIFSIKDPESYGRRSSFEIAKPSTPWLNLSLLALALGFLVSLRSLYLIARRKKAAISSSLLAAKIVLIGGTLLFAGIDFGGDDEANLFCVMSLLAILYATLTYWAYSSPRKLAAVLSRE
jgi:hypothetical protein